MMATLRGRDCDETPGEAAASFDIIFIFSRGAVAKPDYAETPLRSL